MNAPFTNTAAWQPEPKAKNLVVRPGPDQSQPASDEVVIKVACVAINPSEWKIQDTPYIPLQYPHVLGSDVAGEIVLVGKDVTRFRPGDRVIGHCLGLVYGGARHGGFQQYAACREVMVARIPDTMAFTNAVVLPLGISTSVTGLFDHLKLDPPVLTPEPKNKKVVIWGGSSSMGSTAIQLAIAAGYKVITTASIHNHEYVKALGATQVFDHRNPDVVKDILATLSEKDFAGAYDCIGEHETTRACAAISSRLGGGIVPSVLVPPNDLPANVKAAMVNASDPGMVLDHIGAKVWRDFVTPALEKGILQTKPEPKLIAGGLEKVQEAMNMQKKGVSAQKIVVEL